MNEESGHDQIDASSDDSDQGKGSEGGSLMRRIEDSGEWEAVDAKGQEGEAASAFPDLPPDLMPQRPDGTGPFTPADIAEMRESGDTAKLTAEELQRGAKAVALLREKITAITLEFNQGKINHEQFQAIYIRYGEQILLIQQMMEQDPLSGEWREVAEDEGSTQSLRQQLAAQALGCAICMNKTGQALETMGGFDLGEEILAPILSGLAETQAEALTQGHRSTLIEGGRWLGIVSGWYSTTIVLYSKEPSAAQLDRAVTLHKDFEKSNIKALDSGNAGEWLLVFPQRALFENET